MAFELVNKMGKYWNPQNAGDFIEGFYIMFKEVNGKHGPQMTYIIKDRQDRERIVNGSTDLDEWMMGVEPGPFIRIVYKGRKDPGDKKSRKFFEVSVDRTIVPF